MRTPLALRLKDIAITLGVLSVLFAATLQAQTITQIYVFTNSPDGASPRGGLVQGRDGNLYGTTGWGGANTCTSFGDRTTCGTIFKADTAGNVTILHSFTQSDGFDPTGVILASDGNFYGAANQGGAYGFGTVFRLSGSGVFTKLYDFANGSDGEYPEDRLFQASDGNLYGFTQTGLYRATTSGIVTTLFAFVPYPVTYIPAPLNQDTEGHLYATLTEGYCNGNTCPCEAFVKFTLQGTRVSEHDFGCYNTTVGGPSSALIQAVDGNFYGTAGSGTGLAQNGDVFKLDGRTGIITVLHYFDGTARLPDAGPTQGSDGNFYGVLADGQPYESGAAYEVAPDGTYTWLGDLPNNGEDFPIWSLTQHTTGKFYSTLEAESLSYAYYGAIYSVDNGLGPFITFVSPQGRVGSRAQILGQGLTGTTSVTFNGIPAITFTAVSDTFMTAIVPTGATSGPVVVSTPTGTLTSNKSFRVSSW